MFKNRLNQPLFSVAFVIALTIHALVLIYAKNRSLNLVNDLLSRESSKKSTKIDLIDLVPAQEWRKKVGVKGGNKNAMNPDIKPEIKTPGKSKGLSLTNLGAPIFNQEAPAPSTQNPVKNVKNAQTDYYFKYQKEKIIPQSNQQDLLKNEAISTMSGVPSNKATDRMTNFEIRYERPEGVSEDELNSDEKAYYSFYVRSYKNYYSKIYTNYEKMVVEKPALARVFDKKHLLIGKIDYDKDGNIILVKILKSSESDDLHYFFEETLKQLDQPNPPKVFTKNRDRFTIYYQLQIN